MKLLPPYIMTATFITATSLLSATGANSHHPLPVGTDHTHRLSMQARPNTEVSADPGAVWDLSDNERVSRHVPSCVAYGDTLLSETVDGERRWYRLTPDSAFLIREESRLFEHEPLAPLPTSAAGTAAPLTPQAYLTDGLHSHLFPLFRSGTYVSQDPVRGRLIVTPGDTVPAIMTCERCVYRETSPSFLPTDSAAARETEPPQVTFTRYRWFTHGRVPVAIQTETAIQADDSPDIETGILAYVMDFSPFSEDSCPDAPNDGCEQEDLTACILSEAKAGYRDGEIVVTLGAPLDTELAVTLMSDAGVPYLQRMILADEGTTITIPSPPLPAGRYVLSLSAAYVTEKQFIVVN